MLEYATIYPNKPQNKTTESRKVLVNLIKKHDVDIIPIGNGTASRETEAFVAESLKEIEKEVYYTIVSEAVHLFIQHQSLQRKSTQTLTYLLEVQFQSVAVFKIHLQNWLKSILNISVLVSISMT